MNTLPPDEWTVTTLGRVADGFISGGTPSTKQPKYWQGDIPWITSKWLGTRLELLDGEKFICSEAVKNSSTSIVPKDNILFSTVSELEKLVSTGSTLLSARILQGC